MTEEQVGYDVPETERGAAPFAAVCPTLEVEGRTYELRRLGFEDCTAIAGLIGDVWTQAGIGAGHLGAEVSMQSLGMAAFGALLQAVEARGVRILSLAASTLRTVKEDGARAKVTLEELRDPERWPAYWLPRWLTALAEHPDLLAFLEEAKRGQSALAATWQKLSSRWGSTG